MKGFSVLFLKSLEFFDIKIYLGSSRIKKKWKKWKTLFLKIVLSYFTELYITKLQWAFDFSPNLHVLGGENAQNHDGTG